MDSATVRSLFCFLRNFFSEATDIAGECFAPPILPLGKKLQVPSFLLAALQFCPMLPLARGCFSFFERINKNFLVPSVKNTCVQQGRELICETAQCCSLVGVGNSVS